MLGEEHLRSVVGHAHRGHLGAEASEVPEELGAERALVEVDRGGHVVDADVEVRGRTEAQHVSRARQTTWYP